MTEIILWIGLLFIQLISLFFISRASINELFRFLHSIIPSTGAVYMIIAIIFFPGTLVHEFAHFFAAIALFLRVRDIHLLPEWSGNSIKLGHVTYEKQDVVRGILVGVAPLPAGLLVLWGMYEWNVFPSTNMLLNIFLGYIIFTISTTMFSSKQDLIDVAYIIPFLLVLAIPAYIFREGLFNLILFISGNLEAYTDSIIAFWKAINIYIGISLAIHLGFLAIMRIPRFFFRPKHHIHHG